MTGEELARRLAEGTVSLLDVRSAEEYEGAAGYPCDPRQGHIEGAVNVDVAELFQAGDASALRALLEQRGLDTSREIVAYCHSGQRSETAAAILRGAGLAASNYPGSWHEWSRRGPGLTEAS